MNTSAQRIATEINQFCTLIGTNPLLVQGAGGNISWKEEDLLWVKASGKWLSDAENENIFIPVNLVELRKEISKKNFSATPIVQNNSCLRPSIETMLHALMPQKIIVHLHAVEVLALLVRKDASENIRRLIGNSVDWILVDYFKPGADLAKAISQGLISSPKANVIFLKNHGLIIGGENLESIQNTLNIIFAQLETKHNPHTANPNLLTLKLGEKIYDYILCPDLEISRLATDLALINRLRFDWPLYPDHVVFLGSDAFIVNNMDQFKLIEKSTNKPNFIFFIGSGVFESPSVTDAQRAQLRCYFDVVVRQPTNELLSPLSKDQVYELLNWDAEHYRQMISKENKISIPKQ